MEVIELDDDDSEDGEDVEVMDTFPASRPQGRLHTGNSDIFTSLLKEDREEVNIRDDLQCSVHDDSSNCLALEGGVVEYKVVSVFWFNLPKYLTVLSAVQISDSVLFQLQNQSTTGNIALHVYRVDGGVEVPTISFSTSHSIPNSELKMGMANEWQYLPLPLPILIACHEEGKVTGNSSRSCMLSKEFYTQLFPPALSLAKVPLLLIGLPNGNVIYASLTDIHKPQQDIFMGPLCSVEQAVSGLCSFVLHKNSSAFNSLAVVGRSGKILFCVPGRAGSGGPHFELIHSGSPVLSTCQLSPLAVSLTGMQHVRVVDMRPFLPNLIHTVQDNTQLVPLLTKAVRGTRLDVPNGVVTVPVIGNGRYVLVLTVDGGLFLVSTVPENTCISHTSGAGQRLHNSLDKLRHLESHSEKVRKEVEEIETSIGEMNTALHVFHILETDRRNSVFLVDSVLTIESGHPTSAQLKITFKYSGVRTLGEGWSVLISAVPHTQGLHTMPIVSEDFCLFSAPLSERGCFLSSPIARMEPHSVSFFYLEIPACYVYQPLLFTCAIHFCGKGTTGEEQRFALSHTVCSKVMDVLDFFRDVPPNYVTCSAAVQQSVSSLPNVSKQGIWNLDPVTEHSISLVYSKVLVSQYLASSSSSVPDDTHLLAVFLRVVLASSADLLNQVSQGCVSVRELLPDRETVSVSVEALKNGECETVQILISSASYNAAIATADSLADKMVRFADSNIGMYSILSYFLVCVCVWVWVWVWVWVCVCVCVSRVCVIYVYTYTYVHTYLCCMFT